MRLNWNNIGKGLEGIADAKRASDLAKESARYDVTEGAYGPGLQENIQQLEGLRAGVADPAQNSYDPQQLAAYDQGIAELTRRQGLTAPDYSVASGAQNFGTRQEVRQAAAPLRAEGLAGVYRRYGDVERADALETRAYEQQRALAAEERAKAGEARSAQDFATRQTETGLRINRLTQEEAERQNYSGFNAYAAENPNATAAELKDAAFKQFKFTPKQWQEAVNTRLGIGENEQKEFVLGIKNKLKGKNLQQLGSLYNSDPDFDDKTDLAIVPGKNGAVTLNFIDKATNKITGSQTFNNEALATEYLNKQATEPETIGSWMLALQKNQAAIDASKASASRDRAIGSAGGKGGLKQKVADFKEVYGRDPTEAEKGILAGLTNKPREYSAADVNARAKLMLDGGMADPDDPTKPLSPQRAIQIATSELSGVPYVSPVDQLIKDIADARNAKAGTPPAAGAPATTPAAAPAPRGPASLGPDPSRPQPGVSPVTGLSRETPVQAPNVVAAVGRGLDAGQERYKVYLETKIANKQPLTADEKLRAKRLGLQ
jgi:hypothetical protein